jgi:hypothetical protein
LWHEYYDVAFLAAIALIIIFYSVNMFLGAGIVMLASVGATLVILTHRHRRHLTKIGTVTAAYLVSGILAIVLTYLLSLGFTPLNRQIFIIMALTGYALYWLNIFHPPAIFFAASLIIYPLGVLPFVLVLFASIILFIIIRMAVYVWHDHLSLKDYMKEFISEEEEILIDEEKRIKKSLGI